MEIGPILRALSRSKTGPILIALQIAFTLAVVVNALFLINARLEKMARPVGIDADNIVNVIFTLVTPLAMDEKAFVQRDLDAIRAIPGVVDATPILTLLQSGSARAEALRAVPEERDDLMRIGNLNFVDEHGLDAMGVELLAGRNFRADEIGYLGPNQQAVPNVAIISRSMGKALFGEEDALGKVFYDGDDSHTVQVIGVINDVAVGWVANDDELPVSATYNFVLEPFVTERSGHGFNYLIRTKPGLADRMIPQVEDVLFKIDKDRLIERSYTQRDVLARSYGTDRAITRVLIVVAVLMVAITAFGIVGLASFTVNQRRKQIGTRRALGASRADILRYFVLENLLLTTAGVAIGAILAFAFHLFLFNVLKIPRLPLGYIPVGVAIMYLLGLLAVYGPARRAAAVSPAVATRSV